MAAFLEMLGSSLSSAAGPVETAEVLKGKEAVALYFSAHWCPPCRGFTPKLAEWYKKDLQAKGLEVIFVSSDRDEASFNDYFGEMPWLALPYAARDLKATLSKKFKVNGIPSLVILDGEGKVITKDGRSALSEDPTGEEFPWKPRPLRELLAEAKVVSSDGKESELIKAVAGKKAVAIYFSAHWCPPCRGFTPKLAEWYKKDLQAKGLEVIFVSSDRDEAAFKEYFAEMPWLALTYSDRKMKGLLDRHFAVQGIPSLVILDAELNTITKEGRSALSADPEGKDFPWHPKPVGDLRQGPGSINEVPTLVALCEQATEEEQQAMVAAMEPTAKRFLEKAKADGEEEPDLAAALGAGGITDRIRELLGLPAAAEAPKARLALIDIPDEGGFYLAPEDLAITADSVAEFVADYKAGKLERKQLQG